MPSQPQLLELFLAFLKIGLVMFGGGHVMIPVLRYEVVERYGWLPEGEFLDLVAVAESTPGPVAVNAATYVGYRVAGVVGSVVATVAVVLPAFLTILAVASALTRFYENYFVRSVLNGIRGAVLGLVAVALLTIARGIFANLGLAQATATATIALAVFTGVAVARLDPVALVAIAAAVGLLLGVARVW